MSKTILGLTFLISSAALAESTLSCEGSTAGGALFKRVLITTSPTGYPRAVKAELYNASRLRDVKILQVVSTPTSAKLILEKGQNTGSQVSLALYKNQAVVLYEPTSKSADRQLGASVEFLNCQ